VTLDYSGTIHHGSPNFGWYPFTKPTMEMFAGTQTFLLDSGKPTARQVTLNISGCEFNYYYEKVGQICNLSCRCSFSSVQLTNYKFVIRDSFMSTPTPTSTATTIP